MTGLKCTKNPSLIALAAVLAIGIASRGYFMGRSIERFKSMDCSVVKGLSERIVKDDLAELNLDLKEGSDDDEWKSVEKKIRVVSTITFALEQR